MRPAATLIVRLSIGSVAHAEKFTGAVFRKPARGAGAGGKSLHSEKLTLTAGATTKKIDL